VHLPIEIISYNEERPYDALGNLVDDLQAGTLIRMAVT
jgi:hypothetical protein